MTETATIPGRSFYDRLTIPAGLLLTAGSATDFLTHRLISGRAIIWRRNLLAAYTNDALAAHIGNFGHSAGAMILFTVASEVLHHLAAEKNSPALELFANVTPFLGFAFIAGLNFLVESHTPHNSQFVGDMLYGLSGMLIAHMTTQGVIDRFNRFHSASQ